MAVPCDGTFGAFAKKCWRCAKSHHKCLPLDVELYPHWNRLIRAVRDPEEDLDEIADAKASLTASLKALNVNRNKLVGDRPSPRKRTAVAAFAAPADQNVVELQSIRRACLALVEVGKLASRLLFSCASIANISADAGEAQTGEARGDRARSGPRPG